jgi:hypothetical protein
MKTLMVLATIVALLSGCTGDPGAPGGAAPEPLGGKADEGTPSSDPAYEEHYQRLLRYLDSGWSLEHVADLEVTHDFELPKDLGACHILGKGQAWTLLRARFEEILANEDSEQPGIELGWAMARFNELMGDGDFLVCDRDLMTDEGTTGSRTVYRGLNSGFKLSDTVLWE